MRLLWHIRRCLKRCYLKLISVYILGDLVVLIQSTSTHMASSSGPNSIRPSSLSTSPTDLGPIIEDSPAQPKSPKTESIDFGEIQQAPRRSLTQAINTSWTPEERRPGYLRRAKTLHTSNHDHPTFPNKPLERIILGEASSPYPSQKIRRHSTIETKNSASFEETAVWDQKAILSLGMSDISTWGRPPVFEPLHSYHGKTHPLISTVTFWILDPVNLESFIPELSFHNQ